MPLSTTVLTETLSLHSTLLLPWRTVATFHEEVYDPSIHIIDKFLPSTFVTWASHGVSSKVSVKMATIFPSLKGVSPDKRTKFRNVTKLRNTSREHCKRIQFSCITRTRSLARGVVGAVLELAVVYGEKAEMV